MAKKKQQEQTEDVFVNLKYLDKQQDKLEKRLDEKMVRVESSLQSSLHLLQGSLENKLAEIHDSTTKTYQEAVKTNGRVKGLEFLQEHCYIHNVKEDLTKLEQSINKELTEINDSIALFRVIKKYPKITKGVLIILGSSMTVSGVSTLAKILKEIIT